MPPGEEVIPLEWLVCVIIQPVLQFILFLPEPTGEVFVQESLSSYRLCFINPTFSISLRAIFEVDSPSR